MEITEFKIEITNLKSQMRDSLQEQKDEFEFTIEDQKDKIEMLTDKNQHVET